MADDASPNFPDVQRAWARLKKENKVKEVACIISGEVAGGYAKDWCHGLLLVGGYPANPDNTDAQG